MSGVGTYRVTMSGMLCGQFVENVMYFEATTAPSSVPETTYDLLGMIEASLAPAYLPVLPALFTGLAYSAENVTPAGGARLFGNGAWGGVNGSRSGAIGDSSTSAVLCAAAEVSSVNVTGKIFVPGVTITDLANNIFDTGFQGVCATFCDFLMNDITFSADTFRYVVFSKATNTSTMPSVFRLSLNPGTQRRRMRPLL